MRAALPFAAFLVLAHAAAAADPPRFSCEPSTHDFGEVDPSQPRQHVFAIRNTGGSPLAIEKIHAACGCTTFQWDPRQKIPPGGVAMLPVSLSLAGRQGLQEKTIALQTNDPSNRRPVLALRATVSKRLEVDPPVLVLRRETPGGPIEGEVGVRSPARKKLAPSEPKSQSGLLEISTAPADAGGFTLTARLKGELAPGAHPDRVTIQTGDRDNPVLEIETLVSIAGDFAVVPSVCRLTGTGPATRSFLVKAADGRPFEIEGVELPDPAMRWISAPAGQSARRITVSNILSRPSLDGKNISIRVAGTPARTLEVPIHASPHSGHTDPQD